MSVSEGNIVWCKCSWRRGAQDHVFHSRTTEHGKLWSEHSPLYIWACMNFNCTMIISVFRIFSAHVSYVTHVSYIVNSDELLQDADLIMLALASHEVNISILRKVCYSLLIATSGFGKIYNMLNPVIPYTETTFNRSKSQGQATRRSASGFAPWTLPWKGSHCDYADNAIYLCCSS
jgi:hypothetical protein